MTYVLYILKCRDKTYYIGSTTNIKKRLHAHNFLKSGAKYTRMRRPVVLQYSEEYDTYAEVRRREGELKRLTRAQKEKLWMK